MISTREPHDPSSGSVGHGSSTLGPDVVGLSGGLAIQELDELNPPKDLFLFALEIASFSQNFSKRNSNYSNIR